VSFCETVREKSSMQIISKSPNKHNRLYMTAEPLGEEVVKAIDSGDINPEEENKVRARKMADEFKWDIGDARKIWSFGMAPEGKANVVVDMTKGVSYLSEVKDSIVGAFLQATCAGVYCNEAMRGIRFNLEDIVLHPDAIHRGAGQLMPPTKRALFACQMRSEPGLLEPIYLCDITVPNHAISGVYSTLNARRGMIDGKEDRPGTPLCKVKAFLPVLESFGFTQMLRANTSGQAFPQMIFSHWALVAGNVEDEDSKAHEIVLTVRDRKGMKAGLPDFNDYFDKL